MHQSIEGHVIEPHNINQKQIGPYIRSHMSKDLVCILQLQPSPIYSYLMNISSSSIADRKMLPDFPLLLQSLDALRIV